MPRSPESPPSSSSVRRDRGRSAATHAWQQRSSPLARYALLVYALVVVDASLFPFGEWRDVGLSPYDFLQAGWLGHPLPFDLLVNMLGYLPLGFLGGLAVHPRLRGVGLVVVVTVLCAVLSIQMEALQTYLPSRVASTVDVLSNAAGALVGAVLAARLAHTLLDTGRLRVWRTRWFASDASRGLALVLVWFGALVYPDAFVLGTGGLLKVFDPAASALLAGATGLGDLGDPVLAAVRFQLAEAAVAGLTLLSAGLLWLNLLRPGLSWWGRLMLLAAFIVATIAVEALAHAFLFEDAGAWPLLTPGARSGVAAASLLLAVAAFAPRRLRWAVALVAIVVALAIVNVYPDNPYDNPVALAWTRGKLMNFFGLASGLNLVWPYVAIAYLLRHRGRGPSVDPRGADRSAGRCPRPAPRRVERRPPAVADAGPSL